MKRAAVLMVIAMALASGLHADVESASALSSVDSQVRETSLGDLATDALRDCTGTPISLIPAGSFREVTIPRGVVKVDDVQKSLQYPDDKIIIIEVTGEQLAKAMERSVSIHPQKNLGFLQVSGLDVIFDAGAAKGSRVTALTTTSGIRIAANQVYRVATTQPLAEGAYGYFTIWGKNLKTTSTGKTTSQAVGEFLSKKGSVDYGKLDRITVKGK